MNALQKAMLQHSAARTVTMTAFRLTSQDARPSTARAQQVSMFASLDVAETCSTGCRETEPQPRLFGSEIDRVCVTCGKAVTFARP